MDGSVFQAFQIAFWTVEAEKWAPLQLILAKLFCQ